MTIPSKTQSNFNHAVLQAQQRAIAVRKKASFGNSSSGYEFGGWKNLLENDSTPESSAKSSAAINWIKIDLKQDKGVSQKISETTLCPSSQPDKDNAVVFGVVEGTVEEPRVAYLERSQPVNEEIQQLSAPVKPTEMMRLASPCHEQGCLHFDGSDCRLAQRIVEQLPTVTETLPACQIRSSCRWWQQEGKSACLRCPQVVTENYYSSPLFEQVADPNAKLRRVGI
ncbi:MAG: hypothetical protein RLZZ535_2770 [Cyanobacteriota bacterium]